MHEILQSKLSNQQKVGLLAATDAQSKPGILAALKKNQYKIIKLYRQVILESTLEDKQKTHLLAPLSQKTQTKKRKTLEAQQEPPNKIPRLNF